MRWAAPIELAPDMSVSATLATAAEDGLMQLLANEAAARRGANIEGVHQMRVGLRRLKVVLSLAGKLALAPDRDGLKTELDWIGDVLGKARDLDVFITETLDQLGARHGDDAELFSLRQRALKARRAAYASLRRSLDSPRHAEAQRRLGAWIATLGAPAADLESQPPLAEIAVMLLDKRHRRLRKFVRTHGWDTKAELHALRLHAKKLRYTAAFFASLYPPKRTKPFLAAVSELQDVLGRAHDSEVARHILAALGTRPTWSAPPHETWQQADELVDAWHRARSDDVGARIKPAWRALETAKRFW